MRNKYKNAFEVPNLKHIADTQHYFPFFPPNFPKTFPTNINTVLDSKGRPGGLVRHLHTGLKSHWQICTLHLFLLRHLILLKCSLSSKKCCAIRWELSSSHSHRKSWVLLRGPRKHKLALGTDFFSWRLIICIMCWILNNFTPRLSSSNPGATNSSPLSTASGPIWTSLCAYLSQQWNTGWKSKSPIQ